MARDAEAELAGASLHQGLSRLPMSSSLLDWSVRRGVRRNPALGRRASARLGFLRPMGLRICLVSPFAWSQPHDLNEHLAGIAPEPPKLGHAVPVPAPPNPARD